MKRSIRLAVSVLCVVCLLAESTQAGKYNSKLDIGKPAPGWEELPGVDGKTHSRSDLKDKEFVVVVFHSCSCDVAEEYEGRIKRFTERFAAPRHSVAVVAINVSKLEEDRLPAMKKRAERHEIAREFGAIWTPEFFILDRNRNVAYMGGMDDTSAEEFVKHRYLEDAMQTLLNGKPPEVRETPPIGCRIRFERMPRRGARPPRESP
jgi:thioredoxin-related protein